VNVVDISYHFKSPELLHNR